MSAFKDIDGLTYVTQEYCEQAMEKERRNCFWVGFAAGIIGMLFGYYFITPLLARL